MKVEEDILSSVNKTVLIAELLNSQSSWNPRGIRRNDGFTMTGRVFMLHHNGGVMSYYPA